MPVQDTLDQLQSFVQGRHDATSMLVATATLAFYEYFITLDQEVEYFWGRFKPWTASRVLFLMNRYLPLLQILLTMVAIFSNGSITACTHMAKAVMFTHVLAITVVQAILVLRIWYLYSHSLIMRLVPLVLWIVSSTFCVAIVLPQALRQFHAIDLTSILGPNLRGCNVPPPNNLTRIYIPNVILHTVFYVMTTIRAFVAKRRGESTWFARRLVCDGGLLYLVVFVAVVYATIGATHLKDYVVSLPAIYGELPLMAIVIAVSRLLLSIRSLGANIPQHGEWLLNDLELSRTQWRRGPNGEIIVDVPYSPEDDDEPEWERNRSRKGSASSIVVSRVGVMDDHNVPPFPFVSGRDDLPAETWQERYIAPK